MEYGNINKVFELKKQKFHISFCFYGGARDTTAIVINSNYFFTLKGDHFKALKKIAEDTPQGLKACLQYYQERKELHFEGSDGLTDDLEIVPWKYPKKIEAKDNI